MKKHWLWPCGALLLLLATRDMRPARACGGSSSFYSAVVGFPRLQWEGEDYDDVVRPEERFLYPYYALRPREAKLLWQFSYESLQSVAAPDSRAFDQAVASKDDKAAQKLARQLIEQWYALPPVLAAPHRQKTLEAARYLEGGASPSPTQQFLDMMATLAQQLPNGWANRDHAIPTPPVLAQQLRVSDDWLKANARHPLRDLVALWQVRLRFFQGDDTALWSSLFGLFSRRPTRAAAEMRYLVKVGKYPSGAQLEALKDPLLIALFVDDKVTTPQRFERWWQLSEKASARPAAIHLQERLLTVLTHESPKDAPLPKSFPQQAAKPSNYWGKLRGLLLLRYGRTAEAKTQLELLTPDVEQAALLANARFNLGDALSAARVGSLAWDEAHYLMQVLVPDADIPALLSDSDPLIRSEAQRRRAGDLALGGDYAAAAQQLSAADPEQAKFLKEIAAIQRRGNDLELARALSGRSVIAGLDSSFYRGVSMLYAGLAPGNAEAKRTVQFLQACSGSFQALRLFVAWLEANPQAPNARQVLDEADRAYVALGAYGSWPDLFWQKYLEHHELAVRLRKVGKTLRAGPPRIAP